MKRRSVQQRILGALKDFTQKLKSGEVGKLTAYKVQLDLRPRAHDAKSVKAIRRKLQVSQPIFAQLLAVSLGTLRSWEQGHQRPSGPACRLLDRIADDPEQWRSWLLEKSSAH